MTSGVGLKDVALIAALVIMLALSIRSTLEVQRVGDDVESVQREVGQFKDSMKQKSGREDAVLRELLNQRDRLESVGAHVAELSDRLTKAESDLASTESKPVLPSAGIQAPPPVDVRAPKPADKRPMESLPEERPVPALSWEYKQRVATGLDFYMKRQFGVAAHEFYAALAFNTDDWLLRQRLADSYLLDGNYKSAYQELLQAVKQCGGQFPPGLLVECFGSNDEFKAWVDRLESKLQLDPRNEELRFLLGYAYYSGGKSADALEMFKQIAVRAPTNEAAAKMVEQLQTPAPGPEDK
ncbi:MAG: hypothetical protein RDV41_09825 [Planctomycetota bacterium]|nr:hypothetical protein [Planctomycetota bacterium]